MVLETKRALKNVLGEIPLTAEIYWQLRQRGKPLSKSFSLQRVQKHLPAWRAQAQAARRERPDGKRVLIFATLRYWIEHAALLSVALAGIGHEVTLAYLPFANWMKPGNRFDLRRQNAYSRQVFDQAAPLFSAVSFFEHAGQGVLPGELEAAIHEVAIRDTQYTLQIESVDEASDLFRLRARRNRQAAQAMLDLVNAQHGRMRPDVVLTPNGSILEMGAIYQVARYLELPLVTYEFGEQRQRIWLAKDAEVMQQETGTLWQERKDTPLTPQQMDQIRALIASRQRGDLWENFSRRWQGLPSQGAERTRSDLGIASPQDDLRPVVLLAANVIGDSLTLGRQVFTKSMTEWLQGTVRYFSNRPEVQLIVRIHPGERFTKGPSVADVLRQALPHLPEHIHLIYADDPVNTYDLVEIADLGLVYTTTVGLEMALSGLPVIVAGRTHYRGRGFTHDPESWQDYLSQLDAMLAAPEQYRLPRPQVELAWNYAYRFFFEYPCPFPWHLLHFWEELKDWPIDRLLSPEGRSAYEPTLEYLTGADRNWSR